MLGMNVRTGVLTLMIFTATQLIGCGMFSCAGTGGNGAFGAGCNTGVRF
jgi:hypothetical protein